jgi:hypothetical protein
MSDNTVTGRTRDKETLQRKWRFRARGADFEMVSPLWLYPEIDCSACVDDVYDLSGEEQLDYYVDYIRARHPDWWEADAVPICWSVRGDGVFEEAPNNAPYGPTDNGENFLTFWTPPVDAETGEPLNWWRLPVRNMRFPAFAKALGWLPSPFQEFAPLRSIVMNAATAIHSLQSKGART